MAAIYGRVEKCIPLFGKGSGAKPRLRIGEHDVEQDREADKKEKAGLFLVQPFLFYNELNYA